MTRPSDVALEKGLPIALDAERFILGSLLLGYAMYPDVAGALNADDFALVKHRRIFERIGDVDARGERVDYPSVAHALESYGQLEACDGVSYLISLEDGLPRLPNLDGYTRIVKSKAIRRRAIFAARAVAERCLGAGDDDENLLVEAERLLEVLHEGQTQHGEWCTPGDVLGKSGLDEFLNPQSSGLSIPTPWPDLNDSTGGLQAGDLVIIAGRPSMGKSIVGMQLAHTAAKEKRGVAVFSLEMPKESLVKRLLSWRARVDHQRLRSGRLDEGERQRVRAAAVELAGLPLFIDDTRARTIPAQLAAFRKLQAKYPIGLVVVDHLQLMEGINRRADRREQLAEITRFWKGVAGQHGVVALLLSQLNRECESQDRVPCLADLSECGAIEQDADVVMFIHRWERYAQHSHPAALPCSKCGSPNHRGAAQFILGKQRNGPTGLLNMAFLRQWQCFHSHTSASDVPEAEGSSTGERK